MSVVSRPASPADVVRLQYAVPTRLVTIPLAILVAVVVVMSAVTAAIERGGGSSSDLDTNGAVIWSLFGFIASVGVQAVSVTFPLALALGSTRRTFTLGTLTSAAAESVLLAGAALVLLALETLTGGWFVGARVLGDATLGGGNPLVLVAVMFGSTLTALAVGGLYGASWVRFGSRGPLVLGIGTSIVAVLALLLLLAPIVQLVEALGAWSFVLAGAAMVVLSTLGEYLLLRSASVR